MFSWALFAVCLVAFVPQLMTPGSEDPFSLYGPAIAAGEWWRILTAQVEHHGLLHLVVNAMSIVGFGPFIERRVGSIRLALESLFASLVGTAFVLHFNWATWTAGASVIILSWLGLALPIVEPRWRRVLIQWTIFNVLVSLIPGVSRAGHVGGFVAGLLCGLLIRRSDAFVPPTRFRLFDRLLPLLLAAGVALVVLAVRFPTATLLPGALR